MNFRGVVSGRIKVNIDEEKRLKIINDFVAKFYPKMHTDDLVAFVDQEPLENFAEVAHRMNMQKEIETFTQRIKRLEEQNKIMRDAIVEYLEYMKDSNVKSDFPHEDDWAYEALKRCEEME